MKVWNTFITPTVSPSACQADGSLFFFTILLDLMIQAIGLKNNAQHCTNDTQHEYDYVQSKHISLFPFHVYSHESRTRNRFHLPSRSNVLPPRVKGAAVFVCRLHFYYSTGTPWLSIGYFEIPRKSIFAILSKCSLSLCFIIIYNPVSFSLHFIRRSGRIYAIIKITMIRGRFRPIHIR